MVIDLPVKLEFDRKKRLRVRVWKQTVDGQTYKKRTNEQTELHLFQKQPSYDGDLSPCQVLI